MKKKIIRTFIYIVILIIVVAIYKYKKLFYNDSIFVEVPLVLMIVLVLTNIKDLYKLYKEKQS